LSTIKRWRDEYPSFADAFDRGRDRADANVAAALYQRAIGYSHPAEKIHITKDGEVIRVETTQHYPPDPTALSFYLSNRQREHWRRDPDRAVDLNVNFNLEQIVLASLKLDRKAEKPALETGSKVIEHQPSEPDEEG
jgi:hypothetical protein